LCNSRDGAEAARTLAARASGPWIGQNTMAIETPLTDNQAIDPAAHRPDSAPAKAGEEISVLDLLIVLAERKRIVLKITGAFTLLGLVLAFLLPVRYTATVVVLPPQQSQSTSAIASQLSNLSSLASLGGTSLGLKNPNDMYVAMFKSHAVEDAMIQRFGLMREYRKRYLSDARKRFESRVTVDGSGKDGLIHVSVEDHDPGRAAEMANGYVEQFRVLSQHLAITEAAQRRLFFEQQLEQAKDDLAGAEEALKQTEQKTGLIQLDSQARALISAATTLRAQVAAKEMQIQGMQTYATSQNANVVEAEQELESLRTQLAKLGGSEQSPESLIIPKGNVPQLGLDYLRKYRDVKYYETLFDIIARQFELAKLDEAKQGAVIQVVDPAIVPDKKSFPKRTFIVMGAAISGFILGIIAAFLQSGWRRLNADAATSAKFDALRHFLAIRTR